MLSTWMGLSTIQMPQPPQPAYHHLQGVSRASWPHVVTTSLWRPLRAHVPPQEGCLGQPARTVPLASGGLHAQDWADGVWRKSPEQVGRQRGKQGPAKSIPGEGKGPQGTGGAPGHHELREGGLAQGRFGCCLRVAQG